MMINKSIKALSKVIVDPMPCLGIIQSELTFRDDQLVFVPSLPEIE